MASVPEETESANLQTWVLKVSIHCEACEKKVKKILQRVPGVSAVDIDANQNIVKVSGDVDAESLTRKLLKYGKRAEVLPKKIPSTTTAAAAAAATAKTQAVAGEKTTKPETEEKRRDEQGKSVDSSESPPAASTDGEVTIPKPDTQSPEKAEGASSEKAAASSDAGDDGEKKGKKVHMENNIVEERDVSDSSGFVGLSSPVANFQPIYTTVRYETVHPSTSYAYYAAPPPSMPAGYGYFGYPPPPPPAEYTSEYYYPSESYFRSTEQPSSSESYDMFNDENPNACKLM